MWLCHRPGTGMYHFRVVAAPGMLLVYGDVGDYMLQNHDYDMVKWLVGGAVNSPDYLIQKFVRKTKIFFEDEAEALLQSHIDEACDEYERDEAKKFKEKVLDAWQYDREYGHGHDFARAYYEAGGDPEYLSSTEDYDSSVYWTVECLKKFAELYNELRTKSIAGEETCSSCAALSECS